MQDAAIVRQRFVHDIPHLKTTSRVDRLAARQEMRRDFARIDHAHDGLVPAHEELGVLCLLKQERREEHRPIKTTQRVRGGQHRDQLVCDGLLACEKTDRDAQQTLLLLGRDALPVERILRKVEVFDLPVLPHRLLVLAVDLAAHHLSREMELRLNITRHGNPLVERA